MQYVLSDTEHTRQFLAIYLKNKHKKIITITNYLAFTSHFYVVFGK